MRRRDWAGTVLVACLITAAGLLRDHTVLLVLLAVVAVICFAVIVWDVRGKPGPVKGSLRGVLAPETAPVASPSGPPPPQGVHVLPTSHYEAGKLAADAGMSPLERWLQGRIDEAATIAYDRKGEGYLGAMHNWDVQNVDDLRSKWPERVRAYLAHPHNPPYWDGPPVPYSETEDAAYFDRRRDWLKVTLEELRRGR